MKPRHSPTQPLAASSGVLKQVSFIFWKLLAVDCSSVANHLKTNLEKTDSGENPMKTRPALLALLFLATFIASLVSPLAQSKIERPEQKMSTGETSRSLDANQ
jgi:hypothetical protein